MYIFLNMRTYKIRTFGGIREDYEPQKCDSLSTNTVIEFISKTNLLNIYMVTEKNQKFSDCICICISGTFVGPVNTSHCFCLCLF
jgi:hypothetical protein